MSRDPQRLADYLAHILEAIERIDRYTRHMERDAFLGDSLVQDAVIRNLEIIGEASGVFPNAWAPASMLTSTGSQPSQTVRRGPV